MTRLKSDVQWQISDKVISGDLVLTVCQFQHVLETHTRGHYMMEGVWVRCGCGVLGGIGLGGRWIG